MFPYEILPGESLEDIAQHFETTAEKLLKVNGLADASMLQAGTVMCIPGQPELSFFPFPVDLNLAALKVADGLLYVLYTDRPFYTPGQPIHMMFIKTNISPRPVRLTYPSSQRFDFIVSQNKREIWRWSQGRVFLPAVAVAELFPGQSQIYCTVWDQSANNPNELELGPGLFSLQAVNKAAELDEEKIELRLRLELPEPAPEPGPETPRNYLRNPGFEEWLNQNHPAHWTGSNLTRSSFAYNGNFAVELGREPNLQSRISQTLDNLPTGKRYRLCFFARENVPADESNQAGYVFTSTLVFLDEEDRELDATSVRMLAGEIPRNRYQRFCLTTAPAPPATRRIAVRITFAPLTSNKAMVKIDNMILNAF